ncbi:sensor histidine kinase [Tellurirhabdus rosea]|uniref:sensor histidine kinase n=1 Tax=Tellurirhabdus rosea TaxID=2674997 RepID=UPI002257CB82|nr:histidine kinase [Tellurirhabdus rosea]
MASRTIRSMVPFLIHVLGWTLLGSTLLVIQPILYKDVTVPTEYWIKQLLFFGLMIGMFYLNANYLVPRLLFGDKVRVALYVGMVIAAAGFAMLASRQFDQWLNLPELIHRAFHPEDWQARPRRPSAPFDSYAILMTLLIIGISTSVTSVQKWQRDAQVRLALEQQKTSTELSFLKAQINPHFFFNTLNNIYALTLIDVETAREALHKLSRMMRYVLYETQAPTTLLSKELSFVQDYIELMQLRLTDKVTVTFQKPEPVRDVAVAPMILLPFVENAFKHGVSALHPSQIFVGVRQHNGHLSLEVRNTILPDKSQSLETGNGIGLTNTRRRLDLLYPERYNLLVSENTSSNEYRVQLELTIS